MTSVMPIQLLSNLRDNLTAQRQAMLADDLVALSELSKVQQALLATIYQFGFKDLFGSDELSAQDTLLLHEVIELLQTNELLARQSLTYARRMLEALNGHKKDRGYQPPGMCLDRQV